MFYSHTPPRLWMILGVGISEGCFIFHLASLPLEVARPIQPTMCTKVAVKQQSSHTHTPQPTVCSLSQSQQQVSHRRMSFRSFTARSSTHNNRTDIRAISSYVLHTARWSFSSRDVRGVDQLSQFLGSPPFSVHRPPPLGCWHSGKRDIISPIVICPAR